MHAALTTTRGSNEDMAELAVMAGETMVAWLREIDGFHGLVMLTHEETGIAHVISFWESEEIAERHRVARLQLRDRITSTLNVEVQETVPYSVPFATLPALRAP